MLWDVDCWCVAASRQRSCAQVHDCSASYSWMRIYSTWPPCLHYSPDLAPSDYYLFRNLKSYLRGQRYQDDEALKSVVENWLEGQSAEFYSAGIASLPEQELVGGAVSRTLFSRHCKPASARTRTGWRGSQQNSIQQALQACQKNITNASNYMETILKNNSVWFVVQCCFIGTLQNFLIAPRIGSVS